MGKKKKKILVIEDDEGLVNLLRRGLDESGFEITLALEADEGLDKAVLSRPDLIILDILLPDKNGFECLRQLKSNPKTRDIPVVILSNLGQSEEIRKGLQLGAVDYLVKAEFSVNEISKKITQYIK